MHLTLVAKSTIIPYLELFQLTIPPLGVNMNPKIYFLSAVKSTIILYLELFQLTISPMRSEYESKEILSIGHTQLLIDHHLHIQAPHP
jgi:hypothetical protein